MARLVLAVILWALCVATGAAGGCAAARGAGDRAPAPTMVPTASTAASFPAAASILQGFQLGDRDEPRSDWGSWRAGDRVLLGLRIVRGGVETVRYLEVEQTAAIADPGRLTLTLKPEAGAEKRTFHSPVLKTHMRLYNESGEPIGETDGRAPLILLRTGLYDALRLTLDAGDAPPASRQDFARAGVGFASLLVLSTSISENQVLRELLDVFERPALWRFLFDQSVEIRHADPGPSEVEPWRPAEGLQRPALAMPLELAMAGKAVLRGTVIVSPQDPPLGLCGGLVYAEAHNPRDPESRVVVRLLAAQRGTADQEP